MKTNARNLMQVVKEDKGWGSLMFEKDVYSSEEIDNEVDEDEGTHAEEENLQEFPTDISAKNGHLEGPLKHVSNLSIILRAGIVPCQGGPPLAGKAEG